MSFILDALQRAQKAHDQSTVESAPILADRVPDAPANVHRRVGWLALALLAVGTIVLAAWWLGRESAAPPAPTAAPAPVRAQTEPVASPPAPRAAPRAPVRSLDQEAARAQPPARKTRGVAADDADVQQAVDDGATLITPNRKSAKPTSVMVSPGRSQPAEEAPANVPDPSLPQYESLLLNGKINLPNLKMDMHVFNRQPDKRFVFVNFKKYREGDRLDDDTTVEEITSNGAVLNHKGQRFLLGPN